LKKKKKKNPTQVPTQIVIFTGLLSPMGNLY
jgi:hypothetical protein